LELPALTADEIEVPRRNGDFPNNEDIESHTSRIATKSCSNFENNIFFKSF